MPKPRAVRLALPAVLTLTAALATGCTGDSDQDAGPTADRLNLSAQQLKWKDCPAPTAAQGGGEAPSPLPAGAEWQCATMKAPLDWDKPDGETIGIELIRAEASEKKNRIGSLVFNFGGPGGSGITALPAFGEDYAKLRTRYDLVSFDPRGVGRSEPVTCEDDVQLDAYYQQDATPDDSEEEQTLLDNVKTFNEGCEEQAGKVLPHVATTDAARDMDLMRQVLGDEKLHYFGISYGTELGGVYAHLFPENVGRAVFDAVVDPTQTPEQGSLGQAGGFQLALENYAKDCTSKVEDCPVGDTPEDVQERIAQLLKDLDAKPLPGLGQRKLTQTAATNGIAQSLYSKDFWEYLTEGLENAYDGDGRILMALSDSMNGRNLDGTYSNIQSANVAINCADDKPRYSVEDVKAALPEFRETSPLFGDYLAWGMLGCSDWPVTGAADHPDVSAKGSAPIVVIGNTGDPATPYEGARKMVDSLGEGVGIELTYKGEGHGAYDSKNKCVREAVDGYLLDGKEPKAGTVCS
ncbi:alpha/beta fold hydrolase [Streptomyces sp. TRM66268-LWL]|uniref:Alpha/beta fold hydrolase n=1 Tax=Streptomyces polyasparticus TaxID=2767826 RepID=A0ABR7S9D7_9ACTN|nr:alpha/beta hydrolase [Streptomyces polyasparticus]MBC9711146.1 alpha/beta fold hydrolase [Streptomyces polyasparticus]